MIIKHVRIDISPSIVVVHRPQDGLMNPERFIHSASPWIVQHQSVDRLIYDLIDTLYPCVSYYLERSIDLRRWRRMAIEEVLGICEIKLLLHKLIESPEGILGRYCADFVRFWSRSPTSTTTRRDPDRLRRRCTRVSHRVLRWWGYETKRLEL